MVLTWRRGIFHRTLKAEQLIVSSWMSKGGLRRSVSCKKKKEREKRQTQTVSLVAFGNIVPSSDTRPNFSQECWFYSRRTDCRYGDGIFSGGLSDTSGDSVWASSDLRVREKDIYRCWSEIINTLDDAPRDRVQW